jgi:uncharacterized protein (TIGR02246 family)
MSQLTLNDQTTLNQLWRKYLAAFNKQDARAAGRLYAPDGDLLGVEGDLMTGPVAIEKYYLEFFAKFPKATVSGSKIAPAHIIADGAAFINGRWRVRGVTPKPFSVVRTFVVRRDRGTWSYVAVRFFAVP